MQLFIKNFQWKSINSYIVKKKKETYVTFPNKFYLYHSILLSPSPSSYDIFIPFCLIISNTLYFTVSITFLLKFFICPLDSIYLLSFIEV